MFKCKQACVFQDTDKNLHTFEVGKTYTKEEVSAVPADAFKGETPFFIEAIVSDEAADAKPTSKTSKKSATTEEKEDPRV